jgi:hypothetical protein
MSGVKKETEGKKKQGRKSEEGIIQIIFRKNIGGNKTTFSNRQLYSSFRLPVTILVGFQEVWLIKLPQIYRINWILFCLSTFPEESLKTKSLREKESGIGDRKEDRGNRIEEREKRKGVFLKDQHRTKP